MNRSLVVLVPEVLSRSSTGEEVFEHSRFAEELRRDYRGSVHVRRDCADSDDSEAILLLLNNEPSDWMLALPAGSRRSVLARTLPLLTHRSPGMLGMLEQYGLAGGVENARYAHWMSRPAEDTGYGVAGLRRIVALLNGECAEPPFATDRYCHYASRSARSLPSAIAEYCSVLATLDLESADFL